MTEPTRPSCLVTPIPFPSTATGFEAAFETETPTFQSDQLLFLTEDNMSPRGLWSDVAPLEFDRSAPPVDAPGFYDVNGWASYVYAYTGPVGVPMCVTNPVIVAQVSKPVNLGMVEVFAIRPNGEAITNQTYWIDQDFDQAYLCNPATGDVSRTSETNVNGKFKINTTNAVKTGILSPTLDFECGPV